MEETTDSDVMAAESDPTTRERGERCVSNVSGSLALFGQELVLNSEKSHVEKLFSSIIDAWSVSPALRQDGNVG